MQPIAIVAEYKQFQPFPAKNLSIVQAIIYSLVRINIFVRVQFRSCTLLFLPAIMSVSFFTGKCHKNYGLRQRKIRGKIIQRPDVKNHYHGVCPAPFVPAKGAPEMKRQPVHLCDSGKKKDGTREFRQR